MRARLGEMAGGKAFQFICASDMARKMDRIVALSGGVILSKDYRPDGVVVTVTKAV